MANEHVVVNNTFLQLSIGLDETETSVSFTAGHGIRLPEIIAPQFMYGDLLRASTGELERVKVTAHASAADSATIVRAEDGTFALTFVAGDTLAMRIGRSDMDQMPRLGLTEVAAVETGLVIDVYEAANDKSGMITLADNFTVILAGADPNASGSPTLEMTLGITPTGAITIVKGNQLPLAGGDITPLAWLIFKKSWDQWVLLNPLYGDTQSGDYIESAQVSNTRGGYLRPDGAEANTALFLALRNAITRTATVTITIATPGVVTWTGHGIPDHGEITLETTGTLPTGLGVLIKFFVKVLDANTFELAQTPGGASITTSGSQGGIHTGRFYPFGAGDGSATFNVPDVRGRNRIGAGQSQIAVSIDSASVSDTNDDFTIPSNVDTWITGMKVQLTTSAGDLPAPLLVATDYWVIRTSDTTIQLAATLADAQNGTQIDLTDVGSGVHTLTHVLSQRDLGDRGGEEGHAMSINELISHTHSSTTTNNGNTSPGGAFPIPLTISQTTSSTGGNVAMNNMQPFVVNNMWIKT